MMLHTCLGFTRNKKGSNQIHIENMPPLFHTLVIERSIGRYTSTVYEYIDMAYLRMDRRVELTNTLFILDTTWECIRTHSIRSDIFESLLSLGYITTGCDDDIGSLGGESECCCSSDSLRTSGNEDFFGGKTL
jgi:hypothetical protein